MRLAMAQALAEARGRTWGELNHLVFAHPMARVPVVGTLLRLQARARFRGRLAWIAQHVRSTGATRLAGFLQANSPSCATSWTSAISMVP